MAYDKVFTEEELISTAFVRYPELEVCREDILRACDALEACYNGGGRVLLCGNGGSSADCAHIAGELLKGFLSLRRLPADVRAELEKSGELGALCAEKLQGSLAAVDLTAQGAIIAAVANDTDPRLAYAQQLWGLGRKGDVLIGLSTSGNAENVRCAGIAAKALGMVRIAMTGETGGKMGEEFDIAIRVPSSHTPDVQELHLPVYHLLCAVTEYRLFHK